MNQKKLEKKIDELARKKTINKKLIEDLVVEELRDAVEEILNEG